MGRALLVGRLASRDVRRRPAEAALLLLAIMAATTTLTLGLLLHGVINHPYEQTRAATEGPDVVANVTPVPFGGGEPANLDGLKALIHAPGVTSHSGPYPIVEAAARAHGDSAAVQVEARDRLPASVDQPKVTRGTWVRAGGVDVERSFAEAFRLHLGDLISLRGRSFRVVGLAVSAAMPPYPLSFCLSPCGLATSAPTDLQAREPHPGLIWIAHTDLRSLAPTAKSVSYIVNLRLANPADASAFANGHSANALNAPSLEPWQDISAQDGSLVKNERRVLLIGSSLLSLLALASVGVLVGGRMSDQIRRVGLLKAVGGTPRVIAGVLLCEYLVLALVGAAAGLAIGWLASPLLTAPGAGLMGSAGSAPMTPSTVVLVSAVAVGVAALATFLPAVRASRISTIRALANSARRPRRTVSLIAISARLPVPLLLGLRLAARRPRRTLLCVISVAVTVAGTIAVLAAHAQLDAKQGGLSAGLADPRTDRLNQVLMVITVMLIALAAVNAIFIAWATALDARYSLALTRALGATPGQMTSGLSAAQMLPAIAGAVLGIPGGIGLFDAVSPSRQASLPLWWIVAAMVASPVIVAGLTAIPARREARHLVPGILQSELA